MKSLTLRDRRSRACAVAEVIPFPIAQLTAEPGSIYVMFPDRQVSVSGEERCAILWREHWKRAGTPAPPLLLLENGWRLAKLSAEEMCAAGWMPIPAEAAGQ